MACVRAGQKRPPSDYLAQKATELGVAKLQPVFTRRTIVSRVNDERLAANAIEAAEQVGTAERAGNRRTAGAGKNCWRHGRTSGAFIFVMKSGDAQASGAKCWPPSALRIASAATGALPADALRACGGGGPCCYFDRPGRRLRSRWNVRCCARCRLSHRSHWDRASCAPDTAALAALAVWQSWWLVIGTTFFSWRQEWTGNGSRSQQSWQVFAPAHPMRMIRTPRSGCAMLFADRHEHGSGAKYCVADSRNDERDVLDGPP